jgi:hypothetical protein
MGISLTCGNKEFECTYALWHHTRSLLVCATFEYLKDLITRKIIEEDTREQAELDELYKYFSTICASFDEDDYYASFIDNLHDFKFVNLLIQFGVSGIHVVCNKLENHGFYSVGNSYDICELNKKIKPIISNKDTVQFSFVNQFIDVFQESVDKNILVEISDTLIS